MDRWKICPQCGSHMRVIYTDPKSPVGTWVKYKCINKKCNYTTLECEPHR